MISGTIVALPPVCLRVFFFIREPFRDAREAGKA